jgi:hypothetical protein
LVRAHNDGIRNWGPVDEFLDTSRLVASLLNKKAAVSCRSSGQKEVSTLMTNIEDIKRSIDVAVELPEMCLVFQFTFVADPKVKDPTILTANVNIVVSLVI